MKKRLHRRWITLIEVLFAVIIFWVGILSIMIMVIENISLLDRIKNQTTATSLAKEWMELVYNLRDSNLNKSVKWNCRDALDPDCLERFIDSNAYKPQININGYYEMLPTDTNFDSNILYFHTWEIKDVYNWVLFTGFWYDYNANGGEKTIFSRHIYFDRAYLQNWGMADSSKLLKLESHVVYKKWATEEQVVLESFIWEIN